MTTLTEMFKHAIECNDKALIEEVRAQMDAHNTHALAAFHARERAYMQQQQ